MACAEESHRERAVSELAVAAVPGGVLVCGAGRVLASASKQGRHAGSGAEQSEGGYDEAAEEGDPGHDRDEYGPDCDGQYVARSVTARRKNGPPPKKVRGHWQAEEQEREVGGPEQGD
jgi:hypothetical protein